MSKLLNSLRNLIPGKKRTNPEILWSVVDLSENDLAILPFDGIMVETEQTNPEYEKYAGMMVQYANVKIEMETDDGIPNLDFEYYIITNPNKILDDEETLNFLGDLLQCVICENGFVGERDADRNNDLEESSGE